MRASVASVEGDPLPAWDLIVGEASVLLNDSSFIRICACV